MTTKVSRVMSQLATDLAASEGADIVYGAGQWTIVEYDVAGVWFQDAQ